MMKQLLLLMIIFLITPTVASAQDTIVKKNGDVMFCKIQKEDSVNVYITMKKNGQYTNKYINKNDIRSIIYGESKNEASSLPDNVSLGIGVGPDFGGIGVNITLYPQKNIGLFAGIGYPLAGLGFNAGVKLRMVPNEKTQRITPYITAMYGYNAAIYVQNSEGYNKLFYGPTIGAGLDFRSSPSDNIYASVSLLIPIRNSEVNEYLDYLVDELGATIKNKLLPIGFSVGVIFIINRVKDK